LGWISDIFFGINELSFVFESEEIEDFLFYSADIPLFNLLSCELD
jgi:hypothetical protein